MKKQPHLLSIRRGGFTLVELLVVMALIVLLAALMIGFFPSVTTSARESRGAGLLQTWLNIAKQRALRGQTPTGIRLLVNPAAPTQTVQCQYISQPDDFCAGKIYTGTTAAAPLTSTVFFDFSFVYPVDLVNGYTVTPTDMPYWAVQPGDFLEVNGTGLIYRIVSVDASNQITITPPLPTKIVMNNTGNGTASYRVIRGSRALGDEPLLLPDNVIIDLGTNSTYGNPLPYAVDPVTNIRIQVDILFSPSGQVITRGVSTDSINLWVRVPNTDFPTDVFRGDPTLVSVFTRTGFVGAYSPDAAMSSGNPYTFVK